jgi:Tfp pilus assembly protein PilO
MRLKTLFFPIVMIVSVAIFFGYIWPEIGTIKKINEDNIVKTAELQALKVKSESIDEIGREISSNAGVESVVKEYLPEKKAEERIISGINYLVSASGVSLANIALADTTGASVVATAPMIDPMTGEEIVNDTVSLQTVSAKLSLIGEYEKIRIFLDSLQRMPIFNTIKSLNIKKQEIKTVDAAEEVNSSTLVVDVDVDFGYLAVSKINNQQVDDFEIDVDKQIVDALKDYISEKSQMPAGDDGAKGKTNPFLID